MAQVQLQGMAIFAASCELAGGILSSGGAFVSVNFDGATNTYTGTANGVTVFTMEINPSTGDYVYTQFEPFDHADTNDTNEPICLDFGVVARDNDGDTASTTVTITVLDDAPVLFITSS